MLLIHGGGFFTGSGSETLYSADFLINHDVIIVRINYRLHVLGGYSKLIRISRERKKGLTN